MGSATCPVQSLGVLQGSAYRSERIGDALTDGHRDIGSATAIVHADNTTWPEMHACVVCDAVLAKDRWQFGHHEGCADSTAA